MRRKLDRQNLLWGNKYSAAEHTKTINQERNNKMKMHLIKITGDPDTGGILYLSDNLDGLRKEYAIEVLGELDLDIKQPKKMVEKEIKAVTKCGGTVRWIDQWDKENDLPIDAEDVKITFKAPE